MNSRLEGVPPRSPPWADWGQTMGERLLGMSWLL